MNLPETFEPPLSPAPLGGLRRAPVAAGAGRESTGPTDPPLPNRLLRMGLVTLPQLTSAMQQQAETGLELTDVLIRSGIIGVDDLARLDDESAPPPTPAPAPAPAPDPEPLPPAAVEVETHVAAAPV